MRLNKLVVFGLLMAIATFSVTSCRKKKDTVAEITVRDNSGTAVGGAQVTLTPDVNPQQGSTVNESVTRVGYTNQEGVVRFTFNDEYQLGQAGVLVLKIEASSGGNAGQGIIKIEEEQETSETVYI